MYASAKYITIFILLFLSQSLHAAKKEKIKPRENVVTTALEGTFNYFKEKHKPKIDYGPLRVEEYNKNGKKLEMNLSKTFLKINFREEDVAEFKDSIAANLPPQYQHLNPVISINGEPIESLVPNYYRKDIKKDSESLHKNAGGNHNVVKNVSRPFIPQGALNGKNFALWASHGYYFEPKFNQWVVQRPRLFQISEDTYTLSIVYPYLVPMLENAGVNVFMPRERDIQRNEVIVDYDTHKEGEYFESNGRKTNWRNADPDKENDTTGYAPKKKLYRHLDNPFKMGSYRCIKSKVSPNAYTEWIPTIPSTGNYAVYVSYKTVENSVKDAHYTVVHSGGSTDFVVDQTKMGGTWVYLGNFNFTKGKNRAKNCVRLTNQSSRKNNIITADAVRFGGGDGVVERSIEKTNDQMPDPYFYTSQKPKYLECARYWLQMAGYHDSIYAYLDNEYKTDYVSRARWVNDVLTTKNTPVDLAFALHTDAGVNDTMPIGTMAIFMTNDNGKKVYSNGISRRASRDLADLIETEIVSDIKRNFYPKWTDRGLRDDNYYEARVPEVPTVLVELLSHQNFLDMQFAHDPVFRFTVARSIYKAMAKYMAFATGEKVTIQPLPPSHFATALNDDKTVSLSWKAVIDSTEESSAPQAYVVYSAVGNGGFDNGTLVEKEDITLPIEPGKVMRYKVTAVNDGGESMPSEILSAYLHPKETGRVLIVNGFNRVSAPEFYNDSLFGGFLNKDDGGVPDIYEASKCGDQYDFEKTSEYKSNDSPGHGASERNQEGRIIAGNSHNYPYVHGMSLKPLGISFASASDEAFADDHILRGKNYTFVDYILGLEKQTKCGIQTRYNVLDNKTIEALSDYLERGGRLFISGAYLASELYENQSRGEIEKQCVDSVICEVKPNYKEDFAAKYLHFSLNAPYLSDACTLNPSIRTDCPFKASYNWNQEISQYQYPVYTFDAIDKQNGGMILMRYLENGLTAVIGYKGKHRTMVSCIPFEAISKESKRNAFMKAVVKWLK